MLSSRNFQALGFALSKFKIAFVLSLGLVTNTTAITALANNSAGEPSSISQTHLAEAGEGNSPMSDGVYLYGQSPQSEQIGQEYILFKVQQGKVIGAVYMPQSEFSCFSGSLDARQMNLSIVDPYDNTVYPYAIALQDLSPVASGGKLPRDVGLEGYHRISNVSENDRRILNTCLEQLQ
jgi:hypothetical protein